MGLFQGLLGGLTGKLVIGLGVALVVVAGAFVWYHNSTSGRIELLVAQQQLLENAVDTQADTIATLQRNNRVYAEENNTLQAELDAAENRRDNLLTTLRDHNLAVLSQQRPGLIEGIINDATRNAFDELETVTRGGAR